jgi:hypothetical protein
MDPNHFGPKEGQGIRPHIRRNDFLYDLKKKNSTSVATATTNILSVKSPDNKLFGKVQATILTTQN